MSDFKCVENAYMEGEISEKLFKKYKKLYDDYYKKYLRTMGNADAASAAAFKQGVEAYRIKLAKESASLVKHINIGRAISEKIDADMKARMDNWNKLSPLQRKALFLEKPKARDLMSELYQNADNRGRWIFGLVTKDFDDLFDKMGSKWHSTSLSAEKRHAMAEDLVRGVIDKNTNDSDILEMSNLVRDAFDALRDRYVAAGGIMGKIENYFPQRHNAKKLNPNGRLNKEADQKAWVEHLLSKGVLDRENMINPETGLPYGDASVGNRLRAEIGKYQSEIDSGFYQKKVGKNKDGSPRYKEAPVNEGGIEWRKKKIKSINKILKEDDLETQLMDIWTEITTNGRNKLREEAERKRNNEEFSAVRHKGAFSTRHDSSRFLKFKDADAFLTYNKMYGEDDLLGTMFSSMHSVARDVGVMEVLGPKPQSMHEFLKSYIGSKDDWEVSAMGAHMIDGEFNELIGRLNSDGTEGAIWNTWGLLKDTVRSALLGSAAITAIADATMVKLTAKMNRIPEYKALGEYYSHLGSSEKKKLAKQEGFIADIILQSTLSAERMAGGDGTTKVGRWFSTTVVEATGLGNLTRSAEWGVTGSAGAHLHNLIESKTTWANMDKEFKDILEGYNITEQHWGAISKAKIDPDKPPFIMPDNIAQADDALALEASNLVADWIMDMRRYASNAPSLKIRAMSKGYAKSGTFTNAMASSAFMFKQFPINVLLNHTGRVYSGMIKGQGDAYSSAMQMAVGMTVLGGIAIQLTELAKGNEMRDMNDPSFFMESMLKGGSGGLLADMTIGQDYSKFGNSFTDALLGPMGRFSNDVIASTIGQAHAFARGDSSAADWGNKVKSTVASYAPFKTVWYSRMLYERGLLYGFDAWNNPDFNRRLAKREGYMRRDFGNSYFFQPELNRYGLPDEAPKLPFEE